MNLMTKNVCLLFGAAILCAAISTPASAADKGEKKVAPVLNHTMKSLKGKDVDLSNYQGKVILMVNVASKCGYTPQYTGLQELHKKYAEQGLAVLGFPCNQFGKQEPGTSEDIASFCQDNYGVEFDMFSKVDVNAGKGAEQCDLYKVLTSEETNPKMAGPIKWNFEKFLIGRDGQILARFPSKAKPTGPEMTKAIEEALSAK